ncbi:MAG TPA: ferritin-like domain-containing protein [Solirubrobacteraceae bacterium]|nr:ferritin-like domain-containing protein [Solirubrobacteraceae bacterium]
MPVSDLDPGRQSEGIGRRTFLKRGAAMGAGAGALSMLAASSASAASSTTLSQGDAAILQFLAAAEILETDLWDQYDELGGLNGGNPAYIAALSNLDSDQPAYISGNARDERSHAAFLNAYLAAHGAQPVNLEPFRTLPGSQATGAKKNRLRLTNLLSDDVDTSWYLRYRSPLNPDFGATFGQAVTITNQPVVPLNDSDTPPHMKQPVPPVTAQQERMQAIANSASFHFAMIEQGGSSLYATLAEQVSSLEVLRIVTSIGGTEVDHFGVWQDVAANAVEPPLSGVTDPETGTTFPNLDASGQNSTRANNIFPKPCEFIDPSLPHCSVVRPTLSQNGGAMAALTFLTSTGLFKGQSSAFFSAAEQLAQAADAAVRTV